MPVISDPIRTSVDEPVQAKIEQNRRKKHALIECVQMSFRYLPFIFFLEGLIGVNIDRRNYSCG